jgi:hypothetical protein
VPEQRHHHGDAKFHAYGSHDRQGFFVQPAGTGRVSLHYRQPRKIAQGKAS